MNIVRLIKFKHRRQHILIYNLMEVYSLGILNPYLSVPSLHWSTLSNVYWLHFEENCNKIFKDFCCFCFQTPMVKTKNGKTVCGVATVARHLSQTGNISCGQCVDRTVFICFHLDYFTFCIISSSSEQAHVMMYICIII